METVFFFGKKQLIFFSGKNKFKKNVVFSDFFFYSEKKVLDFKIENKKNNLVFWEKTVFSGHSGASFNLPGKNINIVHRRKLSLILITKFPTWCSIHT